MRVFENFDSFLNESSNDAYYLFKRIGGYNIERKPAYTSDLFGSSSFVKIGPEQAGGIEAAGIPVYSSKDIWGKMAPRGIFDKFKTKPKQTIFIIYFNHEQGEFKDYYGMTAFVNTEGADYVRYAFGMDYEPELDMFVMGLPESLDQYEAEIEGEIEIDEAKDYNMEDIRYAMQMAFDEVGFSNALKRLKKIKGGFKMNMSSYMYPTSLENQGIMKAFNDAMGHEFRIDHDSFVKGSVTSVNVMESVEINEGAWSKIMKGVKANSETGPWAIIAVEGKKVVGQEIDIKVKDMIPAAYEAMRKEYPKAKLHIEDATGTVVWNESVEINEGAFVLWYEDQKGKHLLGTFHNKKAAEKYQSEVEEEILDTKGVEGMGMMSKDMWDKKEAPYINEGKIQLKRRYTENYPQISVAKFAPVRNAIIEAIADGQITKEEFETVIKDFSNASKKWARRNTHYFKVTETGISLSKYGKTILNRIKPVNENE